MTSPAGISGYIGFKAEETWGTPVVVDTFHEGFTGGGQVNEIARIPSAGLRAGRRVVSIRKPGGKTVGGAGTFELFSEPMVALLKQMFGAVATTGAGPYTHVATPGDLTGKSMTVQIVKPDSAGNLRAFTYPGTKVGQWTLAATVGELATVELEFSSKDEVLDTDAATASYGTGSPFTFIEGAVSVAGTPVATCTAVSLVGANTLRIDGHRIGSALIREQLENGMREYTGELTTEFESLVAYNRFVDASEVALTLTFDNGTDSLTVTCNVMFDGSTPELSGPELLEQTLPFVCLSATSDAAAVTATLVNGEANA